MSKRKYILKKQDLYSDSPNDFVLQKPLQPKRANQHQINEINKKTIQHQSSECNQVIQKERQNYSPITHQETTKNQFLQYFHQKTQRPQLKKQLSDADRTHQSRQKINPQETKKNSIPSKKPNSSIAFSSSLNHTQPIKRQNPKINHKKSRSKSKSITSHNIKKDKSIIKLNFSESQNHTARNLSSKKKNLKQKMQVLKQEQKSHSIRNDFNCNQQGMQIDSMISPSIQQSENKNKQNKDKMISEILTIKKQKQPLKNKGYIKKIDSQLHFLQTELKNCDMKNKQLQEILTNRQTKIDEQHKQSIRLYKQNKDLSKMIRDLQQLMHKKSIQYEKTIFQSETQLKQKQDLFKIIQAERDALLRKKDRLNEEISKLYESIKLKEGQILSQKQKEQFLISQNHQLIAAYERTKYQLEQAIKINQTQIFFKQLVQKSQEKTTRNNLDLSTFKCSQCHQTIYGNKNTCNQLAKYHMNQKFKTHIKTYQEEVKYWKDEVQFMKTQHQHQIQNIRTVLQCTFQKNLMEKEAKYIQEIGELKQKISIQEELIKNYKNVFNRKQKVIKQDIQPMSQRNLSIQSKQKVKKQGISPETQINLSIQQKKLNTSELEKIGTARSRSYLIDRQVIEEVLAEEQECRPRRNSSVIRMKQSNATLKDSLKNSSLVLGGQNSILQSFKRKIQLSQSNFNSRITKAPYKERQPLSDVINCE